MKPKDLLIIWPTQIEIAKALGVGQPAVAAWFKRKSVPELRQLKAEKLSGGKLKARL